MQEEQLHQARLKGSFIAYYVAGREWFDAWFNDLSRADQAVIFDWLIDRRRAEMGDRRQRRKDEVCHGHVDPARRHPAA